MASPYRRRGPAPGPASSLWILAALLLPAARASSFVPRLFGCKSLDYCNGHGRCIAASPGSPYETCECFPGFGHPDDEAIDKMIDCSQRTCPKGRASNDIPTTSTAAHPLRECSNNGRCDRLLGKCACFDSWSGTSCQRRLCPSDCSGHGQCMSMTELATRSDALPLSRPNSTDRFNTSYPRYDLRPEGETWDESVGVACVCDSSWPVGLGPGERQEPEFFGPDCSQRHCPSNDDPVTVSVNELDCGNVTAAGGRGVGEAGNLCQVDCSNRGSCNPSVGLCSCFNGNFGHDCSRFTL
ncbi:hypothetical protein M885DRAFT_528096 [Pelagophyceae sp. CCMP2097]|nr:hypothetical protein M885DRAFT_528096 [Pelagophyceae sp. CCMP2097]